MINNNDKSSKDCFVSSTMTNAEMEVENADSGRIIVAMGPTTADGDNDEDNTTTTPCITTISHSFQEERLTTMNMKSIAALQLVLLVLVMTTTTTTKRANAFVPVIRAIPGDWGLRNYCLSKSFINEGTTSHNILIPSLSSASRTTSSSSSSSTTRLCVTTTRTEEELFTTEEQDSLKHHTKKNGLSSQSPTTTTTRNVAAPNRGAFAAAAARRRAAAAAAVAAAASGTASAGTTTTAPTKTAPTRPSPPITTKTSSDGNRDNHDGDDPNMPRLGDDGVYHIEDQKQHAALLERFPKHLIVLKCYAPWCRACKGLEPKFLQLVHDAKYERFPMIWADLSIKHNKQFVQSLGVLALPTIQFYVAGALTETFACGPSKVPILKRKLAALVNENVDAKTLQLKASSLASAAATITERKQQQRQEKTARRRVENLPANQTSVEVVRFTDTDRPVTMTDEERKKYSQSIPYLKDLSLADLDRVLDNAKKMTFKANTVLFREGDPGTKFFIVTKGEVEVLQSTGFADPLVARPTAYLGTVINRLQKHDYFGERALITGEPRAASIRVTSDGATCWVISQEDFPASSVLSGQSKNVAGSYQEDLDRVNDKYGVELSDLYLSEVAHQVAESSRACQVRGSVNNPKPIRGVDDDVSLIPVEENDNDVDHDEIGDAIFAKQEKMKINAKVGQKKSKVSDAAAAPVLPHLAVEDQTTIFSVLTRFQMIRHVSRCFEYMRDSKVEWGGDGIRKRRSMLVSRLSSAQRAEFIDTFNIIDSSKDGYISILELKRVMESIGETKYTDDEYMEMMVSTNPGSRISRTSVLSLEDFLGIMAETEFYHLFHDTFSSLDVQQSGYVKARELDRVLCGVRNLVGEESKTILDIDDEDDRDMLIDYEQFTRMLLGTTLL